MTEFIMDKKPPRRGRGAAYVKAVAALVAAAGLTFWAWKVSQRTATPRVSAPAPEPEATVPADPQPVAQPVVTESVQPTPAPAPVVEAAALPDPAVLKIAEAEKLRTEGKLQPAREAALAVLAEATADDVKAAAERILNAVGMELLLTPRPMPEKTDYTVEPGDSLDRIARRFGTTVELIQKSNNLRGPIIRPSDRLRVFTGKWSIVVNKTRNDLVLSMNGQFFKRYRVGTGEFAKTPVGEFKIVDRIAQPTWWHPDGRTIPFGDPENLLGTHWLALDVKGYGLHGTWEPETIGRQASMGCVRLVNDDIAELFTILTIGTPVVIEE